MLKAPTHEHFMKLALAEAEKAFEADEVPVGAVITCKNQVIARAHNYSERLNDFTAHAEMQAYTAATEYLGGKYLDICTLYVTLEPCMMCAGGAFNTRIGTIVFGASDQKRGFTSFQGALTDGRTIVHPKTQIIRGIMEEECSQILSAFFERKRKLE